MDRGLIIILSIAFIVVWMLGKRFLGRSKTPPSNPDTELMRQVEAWFGVAQEQVAFMDEAPRSKREDEWNAMPVERRLELTNNFMTRHFSPRILVLYRDEERLRIGLVHQQQSGRDRIGRLRIYRISSRLLAKCLHIVCTLDILAHIAWKPFLSRLDH